MPPQVHRGGHNALTEIVTKDEFQREKAKVWYLTTLRYFISIAGLILVIAGYLVAGGFLFRELESSNEMTTKRDVKYSLIADIESRLDVLSRELYESIGGADKTGDQQRDKAAWMVEADLLIRSWQKQISTCVTKFGCELQTSTTGQYNTTFIRNYKQADWGIANAILFSATIITTIGYGHIAPHTDAGKLASIGYAVIGLPLMFLCLANIGDVMANAIRYMYGRGCCYCCNRSRKRNHYKYKANETKAAYPDMEDGLEEEVLQDIDDDLDRCVRNITVPISMTLVIIVLYIVVGAVLFAAWERWSLVVGAYFSFTTMSTIGFGDYVPGATSFSSDSNGKMIVSTIYILIGLAVISMCFSLMQEEMAQKFRWLGKKIGIVEDDGDDDDDEDWEDELTKRRRRLDKRKKRAARLKREKAQKQAALMRQSRMMGLIPSTYNPPVIPQDNEVREAEMEKKEMRRERKKQKKEWQKRAGDEDGEERGGDSGDGGQERGEEDERKSDGGDRGNDETDV